MPANPRFLGSRTEAGTPQFRSPEEEELERKRSELEHLQSELAESELGLATLRSELVAFERRYLEVVGSRYAELDRLEAQIAESTARRHPTDPSARQKAESARAHARESAEALGDVGREPPARGFEPTEELKALYRQAAKELHPDLTTDEEDRARRQRAMAELNKAYEECNEERMRQILGEWRSSPEHVHGDDTAAQLVRVIREIAQARKRLDAIKAEVEELMRSELSHLKKQVEEAATRGQNLLAEIAGQLDARIEQARTQLAQVSKAGHAHER
jgi:DNA repair exonuclease SbcCD ATPase subunit